MSADEGKAAADEVDGSGKRQPAAGALRSLPAVGELLALPELRQLEAEVGRPRLLAAVRAAIAQVRGALRAGGLPADTALEGHPWEQEVRRSLAELGRPSPRPVINATGVVIHTNLGRVPLAERAIAAIAEAARGYTDLEYDLRAGERSSRQVHAAALLGELTGAEDALIVNNNAAGVLLATSALAAGGEVIVSRGELVEIGGSFRIPEVIVQGGARLVEVGTTNRTHLRDYQRAIGPATRLLLKVHRSNFVLRGFTAEVGRADLVRLGRDHGLPVVEDLGSGCLIDLTGFGLPGEPTVQQAVAAGCDLVCCSGDKLVGGPQAGLLLGRRETMARLRHHPLMRAVRPDKLTIAGLVATLTSYRDGRAREELPVLRMLSIEAATL
ncbi:MAG: L-seryl-tRNA(Sec) selenium transferase, partial [Deltaproteobacteria bacterium]|nr:L-seryl-tRNA(Sec) selenium transferase [Deltaproteobacteria bacterium]